MLADGVPDTNTSQDDRTGLSQKYQNHVDYIYIFAKYIVYDFCISPNFS